MKSYTPCICHTRTFPVQLESSHCVTTCSKLFPTWACRVEPWNHFDGSSNILDHTHRTDVLSGCWISKILTRCGGTTTWFHNWWERPPGSTSNFIKFWNMRNWISSFSNFLHSTVFLYQKYSKNEYVSFRTLFHSTGVLYCVSLKICPWSFVPLNPKP